MGPHPGTGSRAAQTLPPPSQAWLCTMLSEASTEEDSERPAPSPLSAPSSLASSSLHNTWGSAPPLWPAMGEEGGGDSVSPCSQHLPSPRPSASWPQVPGQCESTLLSGRGLGPRRSQTKAGSLAGKAWRWPLVPLESGESAKGEPADRLLGSIRSCGLPVAEAALSRVATPMEGPEASDEAEAHSGGRRVGADRRHSHPASFPGFPMHHARYRNHLK